MKNLSDLLWAYKENYQVKHQRGIVQSIGNEIAKSFIYPADMVRCLVAALDAQGLSEMGKDIWKLWDDKYEARYWFDRDGKTYRGLKG